MEIAETANVGLKDPECNAFPHSNSELWLAQLVNKLWKDKYNESLSLSVWGECTGKKMLY